MQGKEQLTNFLRKTVKKQRKGFLPRSPSFFLFVFLFGRSQKQFFAGNNSSKNKSKRERVDSTLLHIWMLWVIDSYFHSINFKITSEFFRAVLIPLAEKSLGVGLTRSRLPKTPQGDIDSLRLKKVDT